MKTILNASEDTQKTYTGKCSEWPDGLYSDQSRFTYIAVWNATPIFWGPIHSRPLEIVGTGKHYTRLPGYTGRIASITPEVSQ